MSRNRPLRWTDRGLRVGLALYIIAALAIGWSLSGLIGWWR